MQTQKGDKLSVCPSCGANNQNANAYCKRCGDWLPGLKRRSRGAFGGETPQQNIFTGLFLSALSAVVALFSALALYATYLGTKRSGPFTSPQVFVYASPVGSC